MAVLLMVRLRDCQDYTRLALQCIAAQLDFRAEVRCLDLSLLGVSQYGLLQLGHTMGFSPFFRGAHWCAQRSHL